MTIMLRFRRLALAAALAAATIVVGPSARLSALEISAEELADEIASAKTAAAHNALAAHFRSVAEDNSARATYHEKMISRLSQVGGKQGDTWQHHCSALIRSYRAAQAEALALAKQQEELAKGATE